MLISAVRQQQNPPKLWNITLIIQYHMSFFSSDHSIYLQSVFLQQDSTPSSSSSSSLFIGTHFYILVTNSVNKSWMSHHKAGNYNPPAGSLSLSVVILLMLDENNGSWTFWNNLIQTCSETDDNVLQWCLSLTLLPLFFIAKECSMEPSSGV